MVMLKQEEIEKIERYIKGVADDEEKTFVESLFLNGENNPYLRQSLEQDWNIFLKDASQSAVKLGHILDRVHHIIRKKEINDSKKPMQKLGQIYKKVAAILLLPLLIAGVTLYSYLGKNISEAGQQINSTIYAPLGSRVSFNLPDGTKGMLNSGSHLSYSLPFTKNRQVKLDGEAWLEVSQDGDHPFKINTGNSSLKVLGTSFNVSAYPADNYVEIVLQQGSVEFWDNTSDAKVIMIPSERLVLQHGKIYKTVTDPSKYNAWTEGKLVFRGDSMTDVAHRIERWYNVKVNLVDKELEKYSFRATFQDDSLEDVLHFFSMTSPIAYRITPRELMMDGTYKKEEVTIFLK
jgi:ferric-dicitrate binding protein FerR (iron transport regulator)